MGANNSSENQQGKGLGEESYSPTGLYPSCDWDVKAIKKFVLSKKLAPISKGVERTKEECADPIDPDLEECPICFLVGTLPSLLSLCSYQFVSFILV
jgi:hypothetical protein